jgi:hypothetical protein
MPTVNTPGLSLQRIYSYVNRLPLFTRLVVAAIVLFEAAAILLGNWWDVRAWGALAPDELGFGSCRSRPAPALLGAAALAVCLFAGGYFRLWQPEKLTD